MRHTASHMLAAASRQLKPETKLGVGPSIENGFYHDIDVNEHYTENDLPRLQKIMEKIKKMNYPIVQREVIKEEARQIFVDDPYKLEMINEIEGDTVGISDMGDGFFVTLCEGGHVESTGKVGFFKLTRLAGVYWRGDESKPQLQRVYGLLFPTKEELEQHLKMLEEAKKRDHRKIGKEMKIFMFDDEVGSGLPLWLPNGGTIIEELEKLAKEMEDRAGYQRVKTPHVTKEDLFIRSGHLPYYAESMYPPMEMEGTKYYIKPMNCPFHHKIFANQPHSYRDLPMRLAEYGTCYRYEKSGELFGLMRVRSMQMNDAHIYVTEEQFEKEFLDVINMYMSYFKLFSIDKYVMRFSTHSKEGLGKKYVDNERLWLKTEDMVRNVMKKANIPFVEIANEAAFYGPKIDVQVWSAIGREFTLATNQVDFAQPARFNLTYTNERGEEEVPLCIHRAPLSTHERMIGFLLEHYAGHLPLWLAPVQVAVLPIADDQLDFARKIVEQARAVGLRVTIDDRSVSIGKKIRESELAKVPVMFIVGKKEVADNKVSVRSHANGDEGSKDIAPTIAALQEAASNRSKLNA